MCIFVWYKKTLWFIPETSGKNHHFIYRFSLTFFNRASIALLNCISILYLFHVCEQNFELYVYYDTLLLCIQYACITRSRPANKTNILDVTGRDVAMPPDTKQNWSYNHTDITTATIDFGSYMQLNNRTKYNVLGN